MEANFLIIIAIGVAALIWIMDHILFYTGRVMVYSTFIRCKNILIATCIDALA